MMWKAARFALKSNSHFLRTFATLLAMAWGHDCFAQEHHTEKLAVFAEFKFKPSDTGLFLPVTFEGRKYLFHLDTGSTLVVFDESFRSSLGAPIAQNFTEDMGGHRLRTDEFAPPPAKLGGIILKTSEPVLCANLASARLLSGIEIRGVLGVSLLRQHIVYLDLDNNKVEFLDRPGHTSPTDTLSVTNQSFFQLTAKLPHGEEKFILDSGTQAFGGLEPNKFDELVRANEIKIIGTDVVATLGPQEFVAAGQLEKLEFAGRRFDHPVFLRQAPNRLGWTFMTNFNWLLDYPQKTAATIPRKPGAK